MLPGKIRRKAADKQYFVSHAERDNRGTAGRLNTIAVEIFMGCHCLFNNSCSPNRLHCLLARVIAIAFMEMDRDVLVCSQNRRCPGNPFLKRMIFLVHLGSDSLTGHFKPTLRGVAGTEVTAIRAVTAAESITMQTG